MFSPVKGWSRNPILPESSDDQPADQLHHVQGHDRVRRIHGDDEDFWGPGAKPLRVYFVAPETGIQDRKRSGRPVSSTRMPSSPGMGPAVKLLYAIVERIAEIDPRAGKPLIGRWRVADSSIYRRLWAAAARHPGLVSAEDVGEFIAAADDREFWNIWFFPEIAELRARRFAELEPETQATIVRRLRKGPARKFWPGEMDAEEIEFTLRALAAQELRRIEIAGGVLPAPARKWLLEAFEEFPRLEKMAIDDGFRDPWRPPVFDQSPDTATRYDKIDGEARLHALNDALSHDSTDWEAGDWLRKPEHALKVLSDLESAAGDLDRFARVWDQFGWVYSPPPPDAAPPRDAQGEANRVLRLMNELSDATLEAAIEGLGNWLLTWSPHVVRSELAYFRLAARLAKRRQSSECS